LKAKVMLATVRPPGITRNDQQQIAAEELADLVVVGERLKKITAELKAAGHHPRLHDAADPDDQALWCGPGAGRRFTEMLDMDTLSGAGMLSSP
jgi:hypothetical protein